MLKKARVRPGLFCFSGGDARVARWIRCVHQGEPRFGLCEDETVLLHDGQPWAAPVPTGVVVPFDTLSLLAPVTPGLFIGLWNNFHAAAARQGQAIPTTPLYFLKSPGSIHPPDGLIAPPPGYDGRTLYEGELGIVIGQICTRLDLRAAEAAIFGYTCVNDVTALDLLTADASFAQWARAKSCDTFGPVGPAIVTGLDWQALTVRTLLGGRERQNYPARDMILPPAAIVSLISQEMTLRPGDLIACGTSLGALPMRPGATVEIAIDGIGVLRNRMAGG